MSQPLTDATIALASAAAVPVVTAVVNLAKPFLERLPWADPTNPADKPTHDATLQVCNVLVTICATLVEIALFGYLSDPSQFWIVAAQVIFIALGADFNYRGSSSSSNGGAAGSVALPAPSVASVASALGAAIPAAEAATASSVGLNYVPLHQQALPSAPALVPDAPVLDAAPADDEPPSALDTPTQPVPVVSPASAVPSAPASAI